MVEGGREGGRGGRERRERERRMFLSTGERFVPDAANPDDGREACRQLVSAQSRACIHGGYYLHPFKPHPLQIIVIETMIGKHLKTQQAKFKNEVPSRQCVCVRACVRAYPQGNVCVRVCACVRACVCVYV